jgi:2-amino-4-hydroxy-6-hydroxymethyldihydropteridine diphosphokinase
MPLVYFGLGTNLGDRLATLQAARAALGTLGALEACSSVYETEPWGLLDQPRFLNQCCALRTDLSPTALHAQTKAIEQRLGRQPGVRWGPRLIDIDLLLYDDLRLETESLTIPHPRIADRAFVLAPLAEIAPDRQVPGLDGTVRELRDAIGEWPNLVHVVTPPPPERFALRS